MQLFKLGRNTVAVCRSESTRSGFRHLATLLRNGHEIGNAKACYQNRTWEAYGFQSVLSGLMDTSKENLTSREYKRYSKRIEEQNFIK